MKPLSVDVALIGLGPTGAALAALLGQRGVEVHVFERHPQVYPLPRAVHFDAETMRVFQAAGIAEELLPLLRPLVGMDLVSPGGQLFGQFDADQEAGLHGWPEGFMFHQPDLERVLRARLTELPSVTLHLGVEVTSLTPASEGITLTVHEGGHPHEVRAGWCVACDGARSLGASVVGGGTTDWGVAQPWVVVDLIRESGAEGPDRTVQYCDPDRPATYVPTPGRRCRFEMRLQAGEDGATLLEPAALESYLARWLPPKSYEVERAAVYTFEAAVSERWRDRTLLVAGDAVHRMPPFLGQGMCSGVRDAANLAWKLDLVLRGVARETLLDTYQAERLPHVRRMVEADLYLGDMIGGLAALAADGAAHAPRAVERLASPEYPIGDPLGFDTELTGLPLPQPVSEEGELRDHDLGTGFAVVGPLDPSSWARTTLEPLRTTYLPRPTPNVQAFLDREGVVAALVRPDRLIAAGLRAGADLDRAVETLAAWCTDPESSAEAVRI